MSTLSATLSKKVPISGLEYSSQQFSCGLEFELSGYLSQDAIRQKIHSLYALLHTAIDEEIQKAAANPPAFMHSLRGASRSAGAPAESRRWSNRSSSDSHQSRWSKPGGGTRHNGGGQSGRATQAQVKAIFAIAKANGMERGDLLEMLDERFGVGQPEQLSVKQASKIIETMKESGVRE